MKIPTSLAVLLFGAASLPADNLITNGDFETGTGTAFYQTPGWYNRGTGNNQGTGARSDKGAVIAGSYSATVTDRFPGTPGEFGALTYVQRTDYVIQEGDAFIVSFDWQPADEWWQRANDTVRFVLYATDNNKMNGEVVWSAELTSDKFKGQVGSPMHVSFTSDPVNADALDKNLFVMFYGVDTHDSVTGSPHWARVDNIDVQVLPNKKTP